MPATSPETYNAGLGATRRSRRQKRAREERRNARVQRVEQGTWESRRVFFFRRNVRFAAAAKAYRTARDVTQAELARWYRRAQGTVSTWESGKYSWPDGDEELRDYCRAVDAIADRR